MYRILVVDDELELRQQVATLLTEAGYSVETAASGLDAIAALRANTFALILCDVKMPEMDGYDLLRFVREKEYSTLVALITAHGNVREAVAAIQNGAFDYVEKPIYEKTLLALVAKAQQAYEMISNLTLSAPQSGSQEAVSCIGQGKAMQHIFRLVEKLTSVNTSVLIRGENGTGKELVARAIHFNSPRKDNPFVAVNCGALPENLVESELFGHEKGAFTGADSRKIGKFQFAANGTLFLDEIGEMSLGAQVKLLRVLQEHSFTPVGSNREVRTDTRVIAATNKNLEKAIHDSTFREDLYYRLNVLLIFLPPLRERKEDIPFLVNHFIEKFNPIHHKTILGVTKEALDALENFHWPGNIRELENAIEHAFVVETGRQLSFFSLPEYIRDALRQQRPVSAPATRAADAATATPIDWEKGKEAFERNFIIRALRRHQGRVGRTAEQVNIPKNTLLRKMKKYNIQRKDLAVMDTEPTRGDSP